MDYTTVTVIINRVLLVPNHAQANLLVTSLQTGLLQVDLCYGKIAHTVILKEQLIQRYFAAPQADTSRFSRYQNTAPTTHRKEYT